MVNNLEEEVKSLSHEDIDGMKMKICRLEVENTHLVNEDIHLQAFVHEFYEEVAPLKKENNRLLEEYQTLKEDCDALLLQLNKRDEIIKGL